MARMTEEEATYWDEYYTKNPPTPGPNGTGLFARRKAALAAEHGAETRTITIDKFTADYLTAKAEACRKTPAEIISEMVRENGTLPRIDTSGIREEIDRPHQPNI